MAMRPTALEVCTYGTGMLCADQEAASSGVITLETDHVMVANERIRQAFDRAGAVEVRGHLPSAISDVRCREANFSGCVMRWVPRLPAIWTVARLKCSAMLKNKQVLP